jgi:predicted Zn-dependent peptidase
MAVTGTPSDTIPPMFERTQMPEGPRVISARLPGSRSVAVAAYVLAGSRAETDAQIGVAHFMEHLTFKGTATYPSARSISEAIEGVGGSFNASTDRESTVYWARLPRREARRAMDVLGELVCRPLLDQAEIDQERTVIIDEIRSYLDDPVEHAQLLFSAAMFGAGPLGREICGHEMDVRALPASAIHEFWSSAYRPANVVISVAGDLSHGEAVDMAAAAFGTGNGVVPGFAAAPLLPAGERVMVAARDTAQTQVVLGVPALRRDHPDSWVLVVLNTILGEGMSSRLFQTVREERGLAYDIGSSYVDYADCGAFQVSAGVDPAHLPAAIEAILGELRRTVEEDAPEQELDKVKAYLAGSLEVRLDDTRHLSSWAGGQEALHDRVYTLEEAIGRIAAVSAADLRRLAGELFRDDALRLAVVAPQGTTGALDDALRLG